jgi:hypothetical protein
MIYILFKSLQACLLLSLLKLKIFDLFKWFKMNGIRSTKLSKRSLNKSFNQIYQERKPIPIFSSEFLFKDSLISLFQLISNKSGLLRSLASQIGKIINKVINLSEFSIKGHVIHEHSNTHQILILNTKHNRHFPPLILQQRIRTIFQQHFNYPLLHEVELVLFYL